MNKIEQAQIKLEQYNQKKVKNILNKVDSKEELANQILNLNIEEILNLYKNRNEKSAFTKNAEPVDAINKENLTDKEKEEFIEIGEEVLKKNQFAVVTMAGGQGTRLGCNGPKGTYKLSNGKYIFEILVETLQRENQKYGIELNWYIMTSIENNQITINFLEEHNYFGYNKDKIKFFSQGVLPLVNEEGELLVDKAYKIKEASNGNGGIFKSLKDSGMIKDMKEKNIKWVGITSVDNILVKMVDSLFLGAIIKNKMISGSKSVKKIAPEEKVGVFCKKDGKVGIIEYSDMSEKMLYERKENQELAYVESNIMNHIFNMEALEKLANMDLIYHSAYKKNSYIDENLEEIIPEEPNSYKFEAFIFDGFERLDNMLILRVKREEEFAPIKNAKGVDSPESAMQLYNNYWRNYK